ncbi:MAG: NAD-dependent deacylase [Spirochaetes bacterium]|nr:NAD-dependent deacylase [Spirochaetota bacterium]
MEELYKQAADVIKKSKNLIALTGAGHSVESGIPDFRGPDGLWKKYDPMVYAYIETFKSNPVKSWQMITEMNEIVEKARPNSGHFALARLEALGYLKAVITQNIDNLHQEAGSINVIEFHGNGKRLECLKCGIIYESDDINENEKLPKCKKCSDVLKPTIVFFGEAIPQAALLESMSLAGKADAVLVIGTSAEVYPAAEIPYIAKRNSATIIEMNIERTSLTSSITDILIDGPIGTTLPELLKHIEE